MTKNVIVILVILGSWVIAQDIDRSEDYQQLCRKIQQHFASSPNLARDFQAFQIYFFQELQADYQNAINRKFWVQTKSELWKKLYFQMVPHYGERYVQIFLNDQERNEYYYAELARIKQLIISQAIPTEPIKYIPSQNNGIVFEKIFQKLVSEMTETDPEEFTDEELKQLSQVVRDQHQQIQKILQKGNMGKIINFKEAQNPISYEFNPNKPSLPDQSQQLCQKMSLFTDTMQDLPSENYIRPSDQRYIKNVQHYQDKQLDQAIAQFLPDNK